MVINIHLLEQLISERRQLSININKQFDDLRVDLSELFERDYNESIVSWGTLLFPLTVEIKSPYNIYFSRILEINVVLLKHKLFVEDIRKVVQHKDHKTDYIVTFICAKLKEEE